MVQTASIDAVECLDKGQDVAAPLVINLTASTTPVALSQPRSPELKRFTFFVSRRREEGRERFRLHMGYFNTVAEAEQILALVRDVYPAAWVGPAPGARLTAEGASELSARVLSLRAIEPAPLVDENMLDTSPVAATVNPPTLLCIAKSAAEASPSPATAAPAAVRTVAPVAAKPAPAAAPAADALEAMSNVKEVLALLADEPAPAADARKARVPELQPAAARRVPELKPLKPAKGATKSAAAKPAKPATGPDSLSDTGVLRMLEQGAPQDGEASAAIRLVTPEDTQTLRIIKHDLQRNAAISYAVQLAWSVLPVDSTTLPQLAIFDAYKLYAVEGNRQGRRWYGLRLGFFSSVAAAKQVAWYVRSDFPSVAVVPVTQIERERAGGEPPAAVAAKPATARNPLDPELDGLALLPDAAPAATGAKPVEEEEMRRMPAAPPQVRRRAVTPETLEQTLEILGATTLTLEKSTTVIDDSGLGRPDRKSRRASRFSRLLEKLSERLAQ